MRKTKDQWLKQVGAILVWVGVLSAHRMWEWEWLPSGSSQPGSTRRCLQAFVDKPP